MERFSLSPSLASTEPRCRDSRFSTFAPDQPPYLPVRRARILHARRSRHREPSRGGRFRHAAHLWPARSTLAGRGHARRERVAATGSTRPPLGGSARPKWLPRSGPILTLLGFSARSRRASRQKTSQGETVSDPRFLFLGSIRYGSRQIRLSRQARFSNGHLVEFCLLLYSK